MDKKELIKAGIDIVVNLAVGAAVGNVITALTPVGSKFISKVLVGTGSLIITGMLSEAAQKYVHTTLKI